MLLGNQASVSAFLFTPTLLQILRISSDPTPVGTAWLTSLQETLLSSPMVNFDICEISEYEKDWTFLKSTCNLIFL